MSLAVYVAVGLGFFFVVPRCSHKIGGLGRVVMNEVAVLISKEFAVQMT